MPVPTYLNGFTADYKEKNGTVSINIADSQNGRLFEILYYGEFLEIQMLKYPMIVSTEFSVPKIIARSVKTGEEILLFDRVFHGYDAMFCDSFTEEQIKNRPLKKLDIPPSEIRIWLGYEIDFDDEKDTYDFDENGRCILLNSSTISWEEVKANGMDYIALYYKNEKGKWIEFAEDELA
ncbi:MAG: hypothetical protein K2K91_10345 [Ruminococcus sp.]|nr:hypothetical protein [Ruminococcus sp.]MDE7098412.1 hypothetical protein [Ruminococcus sp.]